MAEEPKFEKNPFCRVKDTAVNVFGGMIDVYCAAGEHMACPVCGSTELKLVRDIEMSPTCYRIACGLETCEFEVPEALGASAYTSEEGITEALKVWDGYAVSVAGNLAALEKDEETLDFMTDGPVMCPDGSIEVVENGKRYIYRDGVKIDVETMDLQYDKDTSETAQSWPPENAEDEA